MRRWHTAAYNWALKKNITVTVVAFLVATWIGLSWAVYRVEVLERDGNIKSFGDGLWWGIVTFLTVGYGDKYPVSTQGRILAGMMMIAGVLAVGILTAKISSYFLEQALREGRGIVDSTRLKNHFVVCGWKEDMHQLLVHILDFNSGLTDKDLVLLANVSPAAVEALHAHPRLKNMNIIVGDYFSEINLKRAAPERARKVMILADRAPGPNGQIATATEVDARTIMTAMTLSTIARGTLIAAEVLDPKMEPYVRLAHVSEVIFSREYNRLLLVNASGGTGVANIIFDLLDPSTPSRITTKEIPEKHFGKTYGELRAQLLSDHPDWVVIGVLENSGSQIAIKEIALKRAQKTTDVRQLLSNLKTVKEMKCNQPIFNPVDSYVVNEGTMAIVIEHPRENVDAGTLKEAA